MTLVSIVTPTIPGREDLLKRCVASVRESDWDQVQHVIVSDRNPKLAAQHSYDVRPGWCRNMTLVQINESWRNPTTEASVGAVPWMIGSRLALGEFVGFCGDDDQLLPHHIRTHVDAMRAAGALWSVSQVHFYVRGEPWMIIGDGSFNLGALDAIGIMCHKDALKVACWDANGEDAADFRLVRDWRNAGLPGVFVPQVTAHHHDGWAARQ